MDADLCEDHDETASLDEGGAGEESAIQGDALESHVSNYESTQREESLMKQVTILRASAQRAQKERACAEDAEMNLRAELEVELDRTLMLKKTLRASEKKCRELQEVAMSSNDGTDLDDQSCPSSAHEELERLLSLEKKRREAVEQELGASRTEIEELSTKLKGALEARADDAAEPMADLGDHTADERVVKALMKRCEAAEKARDDVTVQHDALAAQIEALETRFTAIGEDGEAGDDVVENDENADLTKNSRLRRHMDDMRRMSTIPSCWADMVAQNDYEDDMRADDADPDAELIPGSRRLIAGGIKAKKGGAQFGFTNVNPYSDISVSRLQDEEAMGADDEMQIQKLLKQAGVIKCDDDDLDKLKVPDKEHFTISWFAKLLTKLQSLQVTSLVAKTFGWMDEFSEAVGAPEEMKIWPRSQFCFLDMYHGEKLYEAVMKGKNQQLQIAFRRHGRALGKKSLQKLAEVIAKTFAYTMATAECKKMVDLITMTRPESMTDDLEWVLKAQENCDQVRKKMQFVDIEDLAANNLMIQLGPDIERHSSSFMMLWMTGVCGLDFVEAVCENVVEASQVEGIRLGNSRGTNDFKRGRKDRRDKTDRSAGRAGSVNREDKQECLCCGSWSHKKKECPKIDVVCNCCGKEGHFKRMCTCDKCKKKKEESDKQTGRAGAVKAKSKAGAVKTKSKKHDKSFKKQVKEAKKLIKLAEASDDASSDDSDTSGCTDTSDSSSDIGDDSDDYVASKKKKSSHKGSGKAGAVRSKAKDKSEADGEVESLKKQLKQMKEAEKIRKILEAPDEDEDSSDQSETEQSSSCSSTDSDDDAVPVDSGRRRSRSKTPRRARNTDGSKGRSRSRGRGNLVRGIPLCEDNNGNLSKEDDLADGFHRVLHGAKVERGGMRSDSCFDDNSFGIFHEDEDDEDDDDEDDDNDGFHDACDGEDGQSDWEEQFDLEGETPIYDDDKDVDGHGSDISEDSHFEDVVTEMKTSMQDQREHLHKMSVKGESGILIRDEYRHRLSDAVMAVLVYALTCFMGTDASHGLGASMTSPLDDDVLFGSSKALIATRTRGVVNASRRSTLQMTDLVWDTGCSDWIHGACMEQHEFEAKRYSMDFTGFGDGMEAVSKVKAGLSYPQFSVGCSHRLDGLRQNLAAGWTSRHEGYSTQICGAGGKSCIQLRGSGKRFELIDKEEQPVVGGAIDDGNYRKELGWMAVKNGDGSISHFESSRGRVVKSTRRKGKSNECRLKPKLGLTLAEDCAATKETGQLTERGIAIGEASPEKLEAAKVAKKGTDGRPTLDGIEMLRGEVSQESTNDLCAALDKYPEMMVRLLECEGAALRNSIDSVILDNWLERQEPRPLGRKGWTGVTMYQKLDDTWAISRHSTRRRCLQTPPGECWTGNRLTLLSFQDCVENVEDVSTTWRGNGECAFTEDYKLSLKSVLKKRVPKVADGMKISCNHEEGDETEAEATCKKKVILSLFDGMGCLSMALMDLGKLDLKKHTILGIENSKGARSVCDSANQLEDGTPLVDHSICNDVDEMTEQMIIDMGEIILFAGGAPCGDFSRKRNFAFRDGSMPTTDQRSGFAGRTGILFKKMLTIWKWVKKHNPKCDYFVENVEFKDMDDWEAIERVLGSPLIVNSADLSYTTRRRAYWTSFDVPRSGIKSASKRWKDESRDADYDCMDPGRTLVKTRNSRGEKIVSPFGKSWAIKHGKVIEDTSRPVFVKQKGKKALQYLRPTEAELLMGMEEGCTGRGKSGAANRLKAIGNGWDLNTVKAILKYWEPRCDRDSAHTKVCWEDHHRKDDCPIEEPVVRRTTTWRDGPRSKGRKSSNAFMMRGLPKSKLHSWWYVHKALGHPSNSTMERCCKHKVILGMPEFDWDEIKGEQCIDCDKAQQRMPDKCKKKPEEFKPMHPMQHVYADVAVITESEALDGMKYIVCFREAPGQLRGYYAMRSLREAAEKLELFLEEHVPNVQDRGAFEKGLLIVKPDGDKGAFGKAFKESAAKFGYIVKPSLPNQPDENQAEWAVNEVKRRATCLLEANCLPKTCFPLVLRYISQIACFSPSASHDGYMSPYEYVTGGRKVSLEELIPLGTFGWKAKPKKQRTALGWRGTPVMFLAWDSIYKRSGKRVLSLDSLVEQSAKMKPRNFILGCSWKDFVEEEAQRDKHRRGIEESINRIEQTQGVDFLKSMEHLDDKKPPEIKDGPNGAGLEGRVAKKLLASGKDENGKAVKYNHGDSVMVFCTNGEATGWYSGVVDTSQLDEVQVYFAEDDTYTVHKPNDDKLRLDDKSLKFRLGDAVTVVQSDANSMEGRIVQVKPNKLTVFYDEDGMKSVHSHADRNIKMSLNKPGRSLRTHNERQNMIGDQIAYGAFKENWIEQHGCDKKQLRKMNKRWLRKRQLLTDIFWEDITSGSDCSDEQDGSQDDASHDMEGMLAFDVKTRKAILMVDNNKGEPSVPKGYKNIQFIDDAGVRAEWYQAVLDEHNKSEANGTFEWIPDAKMEQLRKQGIPILRHVWVFKLKRDEEGHYTVYKARGCVDGSRQRQGFDYNETFAPTCREDTFKVLMSLAVPMDWDVKQLDVSSAFTNAYLDEDVYMHCPQGIRGKTKVCKLLRALYGLKQAPRAWYDNFLKTLVADGWERSKLDACLFKKQDTAGHWMYLLVYVDDILVAGSLTGTAETEAYLRSKYKMTVSGRPKDFLGFEVDYVRRGEDPTGNGYCILHQTRYVNEILERFGMTDARPIHSPWETGVMLSKADNAPEGEMIDFPYREFVGSVMYLRTRPDVTYTVNKLAKFTSNPGPKMIAAAKRLLRYLKTYPDGGISFGLNRFESEKEGVANQMKELFARNALYLASDASYGDEVDHGWSTMGHFTMLNGGPLMQKSYEYKATLPEPDSNEGLYQGSVMKSTVEAEYVALSIGTSELMSMQQLLDFFRDTIDDVIDYGPKQQPLCTMATKYDDSMEAGSPAAPMTVFGDNDGSLRITRKREMTKLAKHIKVKHHHIRDLYEHGVIDPVYLNTKDQIADVLTKGLNPIDHLRICRKFMMLPERRTKDGSSIDDLLIKTPEDMVKTVMYLKRRAKTFTMKCDQSARVGAVKSRKYSEPETDRLNDELIMCLENQLKKARRRAAQQ